VQLCVATHIAVILLLRFCGEGAPDWAVLPYLNESAAFPLPIAQPYNLTPDGYPSRADCLKSSFALYYPTAAVGNAFQDFYTNTHGLADAFAVFWSTVAKYFQSNPYVLSYELLNEVCCPALRMFPSCLVKNIWFSCAAVGGRCSEDPRAGVTPCG
jgi:hypothetical protein